MPEQIPDKRHYKLGEVCEIADTQPYVLRFWESEFPQLNPRKSRTGHPIYTRDDVDLILRIKRLLHEKEFTLADARERLDAGEDEAVPAVAELSTGTPDDAPAPVAAAIDPDSVPDLETELDLTRRRLGELRDRYDAAVEEIRRLKARLDAAAEQDEERATLQREAEALRERVATLERAEATGAPARDAAADEVAAERDRLAERVDEPVAAADASAEERDRLASRASELESDVERLSALLRDAADLLREFDGGDGGA